MSRFSPGDRVRVIEEPESYVGKVERGGEPIEGLVFVVIRDNTHRSSAVYLADEGRERLEDGPYVMLNESFLELAEDLDEHDAGLEAALRGAALDGL